MFPVKLKLSVFSPTFSVLLTLPHRETETTPNEQGVRTADQRREGIDGSGVILPAFIPAVSAPRGPGPDSGCKLAANALASGDDAARAHRETR